MALQDAPGQPLQRYQSILAMPEYKTKSVEELRYEVRTHSDSDAANGARRLWGPNGGRSPTGRFAAPADFPRLECSPCPHMYTCSRKFGVVVQGPFPVAPRQTISYDSHVCHRRARTCTDATHRPSLPPPSKKVGRSLSLRLPRCVLPPPPRCSSPECASGSDAAECLRRNTLRA